MELDEGLGGQQSKTYKASTNERSVDYDYDTLTNKFQHDDQEHHSNTFDERIYRIL
jgi:hypothetical protein